MLFYSLKSYIEQESACDRERPRLIPMTIAKMLNADRKEFIGPQLPQNNEDNDLFITGTESPLATLANFASLKKAQSESSIKSGVTPEPSLAAPLVENEGSSNNGDDNTGSLSKIEVLEQQLSENSRFLDEKLRDNKEEDKDEESDDDDKKEEEERRKSTTTEQEVEQTSNENEKKAEAEEVKAKATPEQVIAAQKAKILYKNLLSNPEKAATNEIHEQINRITTEEMPENPLPQALRGVSELNDFDIDLKNMTDIEVQDGNITKIHFGNEAILNVDSSDSNECYSLMINRGISLTRLIRFQSGDEALIALRSALTESAEALLKHLYDEQKIHRKLDLKKVKKFSLDAMRIDVVTLTDDRIVEVYYEDKKSNGHSDMSSLLSKLFGGQMMMMGNGGSSQIGHFNPFAGMGMGF